MAQVEGKSETPELVESAKHSANEIAPNQNPLAADSSSPLTPDFDNEGTRNSAADDIVVIEGPIDRGVFLRALPTSHPMMILWSCLIISFLLLMLGVTLFLIIAGYHSSSPWISMAVAIELLIFAVLAKYQHKISRVTKKLSKIGFEVNAKFLFGISYSVSVPWEKLMEVRIQHYSPGRFGILATGQKGDYLFFYFSNYLSIINLTSLSADKKEALFKAVLRYVPSKCLAPELVMVLTQALSGSNARVNDFTEIWMGEYSRKFQLSNHALLSPGNKVAGRYSILMPLSNRTNLSTYLAEDHSGKRFVLKELVESPDCDASMQAKLAEQFMREASFLSSLNHPRICKIYDSFVENERAYIAMEHIPGHNLREHIRTHGAMSTGEVVEIALQLAEVLRYLHLQEPPVIHRDISPENLIFSAEQKHLYLIDFGAANTYATNRTATLVGKQSYMAPEQFRGKPQPASDVYGLGATLSFLLSAAEPEPLAVAVPPEQPSTDLCQIIASCTEFESSQRPNIEELLSSLRALRPASES